MKKQIYPVNDKQEYDTRFLHVLNDLHDIANFSPREQYLYPLMDKVIFKDFETALEGTIIDFETPENDR